MATDDEHMPALDLLAALDACIDRATACPNALAAADALTAIRRSAAYMAPELHCNLYDDLFAFFILSHVAPCDTEPWTVPIREVWQRNVPRTRKKPPKNAAKIPAKSTS